MEEARPNLEAIHSILTEDAGFEHFGDTLLLFVGGSALHGARLEGKHDLDLYGVYCESPAEQLGLRQSHLNEHGEKVYENTEHFVWSTAGDRRRNTADDVDVNLYGLQKWAGMAAGGDTNSIGFLFANQNIAPMSHIWQRVLDEKFLFLSKHAAYRYWHFAHDQLSRLKGEKGMGKRGQREELVEKYGYDCYDDSQTEYLTEHGWKRFDNIGEAEKVATFDIHTGVLSFEVPKVRVDKLYSGLVYEVEPSLTRCVVTANHKFAVSPAHRNSNTGFSTQFSEWG